MQAISQDKLGHKKEASEQAKKSMESMKSSYAGIVKDRPETLRNEGAAPQVKGIEPDEPPPSVTI